MSLKIEIRKHQHKDKNGNNVIVDCSSGTAKYISGTADPNWYDVTADVGNLYEFQLSENIAGTDTSSTSKRRQSSVSSQIILTGDAYNFVIDWLTATKCSFLNYIDVRITDTVYNYIFKLYELKPDNIELCDNDGCQLTVPLKEADELKSVLEKISIHDDWQGWFGGQQKDFPTIQVFRHFIAYAKAVNLAGWAIMKALDTLSLFSIGTILNAMNVDIDELKNDVYGFGYFLPCPYVRDILQNAMGKIGYTINTPFDVGQEFENDAYCFSKGYYHYINSDTPTSPSQKFIYENREIQQVSSFLDNICELYNCVWQINGTVLYITKIENANLETPLFELLDSQIVSKCKNFSFEKNKAGASYKYQSDGTETGSSETNTYYNDRVDFDKETNNALLSGTFNKDFKFASMSFWGDSFGEDIGRQIYSSALMQTAMIAVTLGLIALSFVTGGGAAAATVLGAPASAGFIASSLIIIAATGVITGFAVSTLNQLDNNSNFGYGNSHFRGSLKVLGGGAMSVPRIIRFNPSSPDNNKKVIETPVASIIINPKYNLNNVAWQNQWSNNYEVPPTAFNFPLVFDANYFGTMYDRHEKTDSSFFLEQSNEIIRVQVALCDDLLTKTGINNDNDTITGRNIIYNGTKYKVLKVEIKYSDFTINYELKKLN